MMIQMDRENVSDRENPNRNATLMQATANNRYPRRGKLTKEITANDPRDAPIVEEVIKNPKPVAPTFKIASAKTGIRKWTELPTIA